MGILAIHALIEGAMRTTSQAGTPPVEFHILIRLQFVIRAFFHKNIWWSLEKDKVDHEVEWIR